MTDDKLRAALDATLAELGESPLPGARYAYTVVKDRMTAALAASATDEEYRRAGEEQQDRDLTAFLAGESGDPPRYRAEDVRAAYEQGRIAGRLAASSVADEVIQPFVAPAVPALDVERLAEAMGRVIDTDDITLLRSDASLIAREYAALSPKEPTE